MKVPLLVTKRGLAKACDMARDLRDKVVAVTGGARGIGYEIASKYLTEGAKLAIILDMDKQLGCEAVQKLSAKHGDNKAVYLYCDVTTDVEDVSKEILCCYNTDILVNSAGVINEVEPRKLININITGTVLFTLKFWEHMRQDQGGKGGTVINMGSIWGYRVDPFFPIMKCTKYAVMGFTKSLGHKANFERSGVRVVAICPGFTETVMAEQPSMWDPSANNEYSKYSKAQLWQKVEAVGNAAVEIFQNADSGTTWLIEGAKPIVEV